jgi:cytochrome c
MKKSIFILLLTALFITSCGETKKEEIKKEVTPEVTPEVKKSKIMGSNDYLVLGEQLFTEKTCTTCHLPDKKAIGPSIKDINKVYKEQNGNIVAFLKGKTEAIVDTDPAQVAIMKANLDGFVKDLTAKEIAALAVYMNSVE